jgi:hypothetical protein
MTCGKFFICIALTLFAGLVCGKEQTREYSPVPVGGLQRGMGCYLQDNRLYAIGGGVMAIFDVSSPLNPRLLGRLDRLGNVRQIVVRGKHAYIAAREHGLWIVDVSDASKPKVISRFDTIELATGLDVAEPIAFIAERTYGVELVDISNPFKPRHLSIRKTSEAQSLRYNAGKLYVGNWARCELTIFDVSDPGNPRELSTSPLSGYGDGVEVRGNLCYAATGHHARTGKDRRGNGHGMDILNIADPDKPVMVGRVYFPKFYNLSNDFWSVRLSGNTAIVADTHNGIFLCDVKYPTRPHITGRIQLPGIKHKSGTCPDSVSSIAVGQGVLYLTGSRTGLWMTVIPDLQPEQVVQNGPVCSASPVLKIPQGFHSYNPGTMVRAVAIQGDIAYVVASSGGLHIVRLSRHGIEPLAIHHVSHAYDVRLRNNLLYIAEGEDGVGIYRLKEENNLEEVGRYRMP